MRVIIQRVSVASVTVEGQITGAIQKGLLLLVGFEAADTVTNLQKVAQKIVQMRIFNDENGKMNLSVLDVGGEILSVSQFTLYADIKKGNRPSFVQAAPAAVAADLYNKFLEELAFTLGKPIKNGIFGAHMMVQLINDGPVTIILDSNEL